MSKETLKNKFKNGMTPNEDDFGELIDSITDPTPAKLRNFMEIKKPREIDFYLKLSNDLMGSFPYSVQWYDNDYFIKGRASKVYGVSNQFTTSHSYHDIATITKGNMWASSFAYDNQYTFEVGTTLTIERNMIDMYGHFYKNKQGGVWKVYVNGVWERDISTYSDSPVSAAKELIVEGRDWDTKTKVELVFAGADPDFPVDSPRGWIINHTTGNKVENSFDIVEYDENYFDLKEKFPLTNDTSNKEFALSISNGDGVANWLPEHNSTPTTTKGTTGFIKIVLDGVEHDPEKPVDRVYFDTAKLIEKVEFRLPEDTEVRAIVTFTATLENGENKNTVRIDWKQDSKVHSGYVIMTPMDTENFVDNLLTDKFEFVPAQLDSESTNNSTYLNKIDSLKYYFTSNREGKENILFTTEITKYTENIKKLFLQHRSGLIEKLYPMQYDSTDKNAGETDYFEGSYKIEIVPNANDIYKLN